MNSNEKAAKIKMAPPPSKAKYLNSCLVVSCGRYLSVVTVPYFRQPLESYPTMCFTTLQYQVFSARQQSSTNVHGLTSNHTLPYDTCFTPLDKSQA